MQDQTSNNQEERIEDNDDNSTKLKRFLKKQISDSTAILVESTPIFAAFETGVAGMSNDVSINARLLAGGLSYSGMGYAYGKGRDLWRKGFGITDKTKESIQTVNDLLYTASFNLAISPLMYFISGSRDLKEIAIGTACAVGFGALNGIPMGYAVDTFRDLAGVRSSKRLPKIIQRQSPRIKKGLAALLIASSIGLTSVVYELNKHFRDYTNKPVASSYQNNQGVNQNGTSK